MIPTATADSNRLKRWDEDSARGQLIYHISRDGTSIFLNILYSYDPGFGTECYQRIIQKSFKYGLRGEVHTIGIGSSHLFHLYMGMRPVIINKEMIETLIFLLNENLKNKRPDTKKLGEMKLVMSEEGKSRWKETITKKIPFVPFRKLKHLYSFISPAQKNDLKNIIKIRLESLGKIQHLSKI